MRALDAMGVAYKVIIEAAEYSAYSAALGADKLLVLDPQYQRDFDACMELAPEQSRGSGPARNFAWDHAVASGAAAHWVIDDNVRGFTRLNRGTRIQCADGTYFRCMEDFIARYSNVAMAGPNYEFFCPHRKRWPVFKLNTKVYSCILIRNDIPFRWRCRYNEDVDLSLRVLKAGWCTVQFNAFLQRKMATQSMGGGNTAAFYAAEGTLPKSQMLVRLHPDVARLTRKFGRWHHHVDYSGFETKLVRRSDVVIPEGIDEYGMRLVQLTQKDTPSTMA